MRVEILDINASWRDVADAARTTVGMDTGEGEVSRQWILKMLLAEHSPIRKIHISWKWIDLPSWVSVHFVRHKFGIEHWVRSQRSDRTGIDRDLLSQNSLVNHECEANAQAIINISRKRLCNQASLETRLAWAEVIKSFERQEPELANVCVPDCVYRGKCYEFKSCGYDKTSHYQIELQKYRGLIHD